MISRRYINRLKLSLMHISLLAGIPEEFKVNIYIGWLFKLIPLIMGLICIALGGFVLESSGQSEYFVAGHVLISLAAICLALFTTAFIIISQLTRGVNTFYNTLFPIIGYAGSIITMIWGWALLAGNDVMADEFVAGHVIFGVGMIAACVSTVAASSGHFLLIPKNAALDAAGKRHGGRWRTICLPDGVDGSGTRFAQSRSPRRYSQG